MDLPVVTTMKGTKEKKRAKTKIVVRYIVKMKVGEME